MSRRNVREGERREREEGERGRERERERERGGGREGGCSREIGCSRDKRGRSIEAVRAEKEPRKQLPTPAHDSPTPETA